MVGTRNLSVETHIDDSIKNWVTDQVIQATNELNQKIDTVNTCLNDILSQMHFLVNDVNRLRGGEGTSKFSRYDTSIKEYHSQFEQLLTQVDTTESQSVNAFSLANFQEASLAVIKQKSAPLLPTPRNTTNY
ncbi:hypothetical protein Tco_1140659 [Tanacetum coccineum]